VDPSCQPYFQLSLHHHLAGIATLIKTSKPLGQQRDDGAEGRNGPIAVGRVDVTQPDGMNVLIMIAAINGYGGKYAACSNAMMKIPLMNARQNIRCIVTLTVR